MNTETTTIAMYTNLKKKQQDFIRMMHRDCEPNETEFTRGELKKIANDNGIAWAPAWIVKDVSRCVRRGVYRVPELAAYRASLTEYVITEENVAGEASDIAGTFDLTDAIADAIATA